MKSHENKLYILNNEHYWHRCGAHARNIEPVFTNSYIVENNYFKCSYRDCFFKFPCLLGPSIYTEKPIKLHNNKIIYPMGPPYTVYWAHLEQHKSGYIELDISPFL